MSIQSTASASDSMSEGSVTGSCISDKIAINAVEFGRRTVDEQVSALALAWILLLYRGTAYGHDGFFTWGFSNLGKPTSQEDSGHISDIITSGTDRLSNLLEIIQRRRRRGFPLDDAGSLNSEIPAFFSNFDPSGPRPEVCCCERVPYTHFFINSSFLISNKSSGHARLK